MNKYTLFGGLAGAVFSVAVAQAQQAPAPQGAAPADQGCSFLGCLLHWRSEQPQEPQTQTQRSVAETGPADPSAPQQQPAKPVHVVTIAADPAEMARLKRLAAALPKEKIKIVKVGEGAKMHTDFAVATSLDPHAGDTAEAKLFTEQLHVVAGPQIKDLTDLRGKVVSFGPEKSASQLAGRRAFAALGVKVQETPLDVDNALDGLATGDLAAVVLLAPQPFERLTRVSAPGLHLVSWPDGTNPPDGASVASIDGTAYPTLAKPGETIKTMGVDALLTMSGKAAHDAAAKSFLKTLNHNSDMLAKRGFDLLKAETNGPDGKRFAAR